MKIVKMNALNLGSILLSTALLFTACNNRENPEPTPVVETARVKVIHASPDAPAVDLLVDNSLVNNTPLAFPANTGYLEVPAGTRSIAVNVAGTQTTAISAELPIEANKNYSVFAINTVSNIEPLVLEDDLTPPAAGQAHVRFIHLSPDAPAVDVALQGGDVVFGNRAFSEFTSFTPLAAGSYDLEVRVAGTETVALPLPGIVLEAGKIYTVFAKGLLSGEGAQSLGAEIIIHN